MVRLLNIAAGLLALFTTAEACRGYYQCKNSDGSHCCVIGASKGRDACPSYCTGGDPDWPPECLSLISGSKRHLC